MFELHNAGLDDDTYTTRRLVLVQEFLERFPAEDAHTQCEFIRGQGEALWQLGRQAEAKAVFADAIRRLPDEAWLYIGWADHYWQWESTPGDYVRGEAILRRTLARDTIDDRESVLERLHDLYQRWEKPQEAATAAKELATLERSSSPPHADCRLICGGRQGRNTALAGHGPSQAQRSLLVRRRQEVQALSHESGPPLALKAG